MKVGHFTFTQKTTLYFLYSTEKSPSNIENINILSVLQLVVLSLSFFHITILDLSEEQITKLWNGNFEPNFHKWILRFTMYTYMHFMPLSRQSTC